MLAMIAATPNAVVWKSAWPVAWRSAGSSVGDRQDDGDDDARERETGSGPGWPGSGSWNQDRGHDTNATLYAMAPTTNSPRKPTRMAIQPATSIDGTSVNAEIPADSATTDGLPPSSTMRRLRNV